MLKMQHFCTRQMYTGILTRCFSSKSCNKWTSGKVRSTFLNYFKGKDHLYVPSSSVIPKQDEGTYFINAGMNQFKPIFLDKVNKNSEMASLKRAVNSQKCIRVGGKHNDLNDVGKDTYHHTFFEMLGSWSFGDYFKKEACVMAWELLTKEYQLPADRLYVSYFGGNDALGIAADTQCKDLWIEIGVPESRILPFGMSDNFWDMGETGPCGPCTEIHYDHVGGRDASTLVNSGSPEVVELWNLVFMQFNRQMDQSLQRLSKHHVDTGMGLERLTAVLQGKVSNYDTDLFVPIFEAIHKQAGCRPYKGLLGTDDVSGIDTAYRVVADHARMLTIALSDGVLPGRNTNNAKVRQIMHRCIHQSKEVLGAPKRTVGSLVQVVVDSLGEAFPELTKNVQAIEDVVHVTEERYWDAVEVGKKIISKALSHYCIQRGQQLSGEQAYEICQGRFGRQVSLDILCAVTETHNISVNTEAYERILHEKQAGVSRVPLPEEISVLTAQDIEWLKMNSISPTDVSAVYQYTGHNGVYSFAEVNTKIEAIKVCNTFVNEISEGIRAAIIVHNTSFYAEQGGQIGDQGYLYGSNGSVFKVEDTQQTEGYVLHIGTLQTGVMTTNNCDITMCVDQARRESCMCNHSATHILNYCVSKVLGPATQQGSTVNDYKLYFDFSLRSGLVNVTSKELEKISSLANDIIEKKMTVYKGSLGITKAKGVCGMRYLDNTVYPDEVKVVSMGVPIDQLVSYNIDDIEVPCSAEICCGTHVDNTGDLEKLCITGFQGNQAGIKSITAMTGEHAAKAVTKGRNLRKKLSLLKEWINQKSNKDLWQPTAKEIKRIIGHDTLPRIDREFVENELSKLEKRLQKTVSLKEELKADLIQQYIQAKEEHGYLVTIFPAAKSRDIVSIVASVDIDVPLMLLFPSRDKQNMIHGVCYVPDHMDMEEFSQETWASCICENNLGKHFKAKSLHSGNKDIQVINIPIQPRTCDTAIAELKHLAAQFYLPLLDKLKTSNK